jgi:hypothetical protein
MTPILAHRLNDDTLIRLRDLAPDQIEAGLMWLAGYDPEVFSATLDAARTWGCRSIQETRIDWAPYCAVCGAPIGVFTALGDDYRHYRNEANPAPYDANHVPVVGWHPVAISS